MPIHTPREAEIALIQLGHALCALDEALPSVLYATSVTDLATHRRINTYEALELFRALAVRIQAKQEIHQAARFAAGTIELM